MNYTEYYNAVHDEVREFGYSTLQISMFDTDIYICWMDGKSIEECIEEVF